MILTRNDLFSQNNAVFSIRVIKYGYSNKSFILTVTIYTNLVQIRVLGANCGKIMNLYGEKILLASLCINLARITVLSTHHIVDYT